MLLNVTYQGTSADVDVQIDYEANDADVKRIAVEMLRSGSIAGMHVPDVADAAFENFVVDRSRTPEGGERLFLRPKVPFGR